VVSLGAAKGQAWILHNLAALKVPIVSHLGAVVNFVADRVARAPAWMQRLGLEWVWRILEEPKLWRRYLADGLALIKLVFTKVLPYALWLRMQAPETTASTELHVKESPDHVEVALPAALSLANQASLIEQLSPVVAMGKGLSLNMAQESYIDPAGLGLILWLEHHVLHAGKELAITQASPAIHRVLRWNNMTLLVA
jgi:N-acetylglucosaminyldiphosphoundecaprenol N-acetyl-beta-D-mannosaminyltransferase